MRKQGSEKLNKVTSVIQPVNGIKPESVQGMALISMLCCLPFSLTAMFLMNSPHFVTLMCQESSSGHPWLRGQLPGPTPRQLQLYTPIMGLGPRHSFLPTLSYLQSKLFTVIFLSVASDIILVTFHHNIIICPLLLGYKLHEIYDPLQALATEPGA